MIKKGIVLKTFIFTTVLITSVMLVSMGVLYFTLPDYYFYLKEKGLNENSNVLAQELSNAESMEKCVELIASFATKNNVDILPYDANGYFIADMSSQFILLNESGRFMLRVKVIEDNVFYNAEPSNEKNVFNEAETTSKGIVRSHGITIGLEPVTAEGIEPGMSVLEAKRMPAYSSFSDVALTRKSSFSDISLTREIGGPHIGSVYIISNLQPIDEAKSVILSLTPYLLAFDILIALAAAYFYAKRISRPILAISGAATRMQQMIPGTVSNIRTDDELGELSLNLDNMYVSLCANIEKLQEEMTAAHQLEQSKTDFMRAASHELKTPIAALNGITEGMIDGIGIYKNKEKYLTESKKLIDRLSQLVNEILNASAVDNINDAVSFEPVDISLIIRKALKGYSLFIEEKNLRVSFEPFDFVCHTDKQILLNAISNLISNAVKYTDTGGEIKISFSREQDSGVLAIENQCGNISDDELQKLFEPFYSRSYSRDRSKSGTGLGLFIVKRNLERLNILYKFENTQSGVRFCMTFKNT